MSIVISAKLCLFCFLIYGVVVSYHIFYTIISFRQLWYIKLFYAFSFMSVCFQFSISNLHSSTLPSIINRLHCWVGLFRVVYCFIFPCSSPLPCLLACTPMSREYCIGWYIQLVVSFAIQNSWLQQIVFYMIRFMAFSTVVFCYSKTKAIPYCKFGTFLKKIQWIVS